MFLRHLRMDFGCSRILPRVDCKKLMVIYTLTISIVLGSNPAQSPCKYFLDWGLEHDNVFSSLVCIFISSLFMH